MKVKVKVKKARFFTRTTYYGSTYYGLLWLHVHAGLRARLLHVHLGVHAPRLRNRHVLAALQGGSPNPNPNPYPNPNDNPNPNPNQVAKRRAANIEGARTMGCLGAVAW